MKITIRRIMILTVVLTYHSCTLFSAVGGINQSRLNLGFLTPSFVDQITPQKIDHSQWDFLLKKYVDEEGLVDYKNLMADREILKSYLKLLSEQNPSEDWSENEVLAYYINTYNAYTVDLILENYPIRSIKDISRAWTRRIVPIGNKHLSLAGIENGILRKMEEPRIHFAINCASYSCPNLLNEAYTSDEIDEQLERVTTAFISSDKNDIHPNNPRLSSIFDWYAKDFKVDGKKNVIAFINQYSQIKILANAVIDYKTYDWNLNE